MVYPNDGLQYNTILSHFTMLSFIGEIQWENSRVNPIPWVCKTVGQHISQKKFFGAHWPSGPPPRSPRGGLSPLSPLGWDECTVNLGYKHGCSILSLEIKLHNQQSPTWRLIIATPPLLQFLAYALDLGLGKFLIFTFMLEGQ